MNILYNKLAHGEFVAAYHSARIRVTFDPPAAARFLSARLMLPLFMLPVLGLGVALALLGWIWTGLAVIALGIVIPRLIKRGAPHFLLTQALADAALYDDLIKSGVMHITAPAEHPASLP